MSTLAERLGHGPDDRLVIVSCDDLGLCHAANVGTYQALRDGAATTSGLMIPAPWARDAGAGYRGDDVGVQLTVNAEHERYRWAPITHAPSLLDGDGGYPRTVEDLWDHADLDEVRRELRAQVERAILWGFDVTHLADHLGALQLRPEFFDVYLDLAVELRLPIRLFDAAAEQAAGFPFRKLAAEEGILFPDHLVQTHGVGSLAALDEVLSDLPAGVTELSLRPAVDTPELRAATADWAGRVEDLGLTAASGPLQAALDQAGAVRIGYRALRDLQRDDASATA